MNYLRSLNADEKIIEFWESRNPSSLMSSLLGDRRDRPFRKGLDLRSGEDMSWVQPPPSPKPLCPLPGSREEPKQYQRESDSQV